MFDEIMNVSLNIAIMTLFVLTVQLPIQSKIPIWEIKIFGFP